MNASNTTSGFERRRAVLSTLWIFAVLNYIYADVYTLFFNPVLKPEAWKKFLAGDAGGVQITPGFVLVTAILMETAIAMVLLSRVLPYRANRWANILSGRVPHPVRRLVADRRRAGRLLCDVCGDRGRHHPVHRLVCLEVARPCRAGGAVRTPWHWGETMIYQIRVQGHLGPQLGRLVRGLRHHAGRRRRYPPDRPYRRSGRAVRPAEEST